MAASFCRAGCGRTGSESEYRSHVVDCAILSVAGYGIFSCGPDTHGLAIVIAAMLWFHKARGT